MNQEISEEERQAIIARERAHYRAIQEANAKRPPPTDEEWAEMDRLKDLYDEQHPEEDWRIKRIDKS